MTQTDKTPPRDAVYQLVLEGALNLIRFDRYLSYLDKRSIMAWNTAQTTTGLRCIEAWCYGDFGNLGNLNDPSDQPHRKAAHARGEKLQLDRLTDLQYQGLHMIYTIVCVSEMRPGRSLGRGYEIVLPGMTGDWYTEMIDETFDIVKQCGGDRALSIDVWLRTKRKPVIDKELSAFKARRAAKAKRKASETTDTTREHVADVIPLFSSKIS